MGRVSSYVTVATEEKRAYERLLRLCPACDSTMVYLRRDYALGTTQKAGHNRVDLVTCGNCGLRGRDSHDMAQAVMRWNSPKWRARLAGDDLLICKAAKEYAEVAADLDKIWRRVQREKS